MEPTYAKIITPIPGLKSQHLTSRRKIAIPDGAISNIPIFIHKAENAILTDVDGNRFIDFGAGIGVINSGHANPQVSAAVKNQIAHFSHTSFHFAPYENYIALAEKLNAITPGKFHKKTYLVNSGAEAIENAVKIARKWSGRKAIVGFYNAFHGRTLLGISLTGKAIPYREGFGPLAPEIYHIPIPEHDIAAGSELDFAKILKEIVPPSEIAAFIFEPILGEGGVVPFPKNFLNKLAQFAHQNESLLIADEIQTGWARTGKLFAVEHFGVAPDIVVTAKSLANGLPLSAVVGRAEVMDAVQAGGIGSTYGGNPVACAAALASIDFILKNKLADRANEIGTIVRQQLEKIKNQCEEIIAVRGLGGMYGIEFSDSKKPHLAAAELVKSIQVACCQNGLLVLKAGSHGQVVRLLPPLTIEMEALNEGLDILARSISTILAKN